MVHKIKRETAKTRPKLVIEVKGTTAHAKKMEWDVHRFGKVYKARRKKKTWSVSPKKQRRVDVGARGRGKRVIKVTGKTDLKRHGYAIHKSASERRKALKKADEMYGSRAVWNKLHAMTIMRAPVVKGTKRLRTPAQLESYKKFKADRDFVMKTLMSKKERLKMTRPAVKKWKGMSPQARARAMPERG